MLNANLEDYRVPTAADLPPRLDIEFLGGADEAANSIGARGLGEPPIIPVPAAIANAVRDAIGVRVTTLPITPARVLAALGKAPEPPCETRLGPTKTARPESSTSPQRTSKPRRAPSKAKAKRDRRGRR
jgi:xanthine dehydrogenase YagR molybdenum-binding subunit